MTKELKIFFDDKEFKKLSNEKEQAKIVGVAFNWSDYILKLASIRKVEKPSISKINERRLD
jgi:hypothetical protein